MLFVTGNLENFCEQKRLLRTFYITLQLVRCHREKHLEEFCNLCKKIIEYYSIKNKDCPLLNKDLNISLAFLVDFLTHVNNLNQKGKATKFVSCSIKIQDFCDKCRLLKGHLQQCSFFHFPQLKEIKVDKTIVLFCSVFDAMLPDFADGFQDFFDRISTTLRLVAFPDLVKTRKRSITSSNEIGGDEE